MKRRAPLVAAAPQLIAVIEAGSRAGHSPGHGKKDKPPAPMSPLPET